MNIETRLRQWIRQGYCGTMDEPLDDYGKRVIRAVLDEIALTDAEQARLPQFGVATFSKLNGPRFSGDKDFVSAARVFQTRADQGAFAMLVHVLRRTDALTPAEVQDAFDEAHENNTITDEEAARVWGKAASGKRARKGSAALSAALRKVATVAGTIRAALRNLGDRLRRVWAWIRDEISARLDL